ncbi:Mps one binder kinase activator-like 2, partial [Heterocephalus glaber]
LCPPRPVPKKISYHCCICNLWIRGLSIYYYWLIIIINYVNLPSVESQPPGFKTGEEKPASGQGTPVQLGLCRQFHLGTLDTGGPLSQLVLRSQYPWSDDDGLQPSFWLAASSQGSSKRVYHLLSTHPCTGLLFPWTLLRTSQVLAASCLALYPSKVKASSLAQIEGGGHFRGREPGTELTSQPGLAPTHQPTVSLIMLGDHCGLPADRALLSQPPKTGFCCKMVLQAVSKVLRKSKAKPNGKKPASEEKKMYLEPEHTKSRITDFEFKELVVLPREIDLNEWLASNTTTFFHHINLQYSTISEFCTGETCQTMAVCNTQYYWYDERGKKVKCTAPQYVDFVMSSVQKLVTDEDMFPTKYGREFPSSFEALVKKICKYLFHVLGHIYWAHFKETLALELHGHLNTLYIHFILFTREFSLLDPKETAIMDDLTEVLCCSPGREFPSSFEALVKKICKYLFHVLGHIYWAHFKETLALELHGHLNTLYIHFILFTREFSLLDPKETAIMDDLTEVLCCSPGGGGDGDGASGGASGAQNHVKER